MLSEGLPEEANIDLVTVQGGYALMTSFPHARSGHPGRIDMTIFCRGWLSLELNAMRIVRVEGYE